MKNTVSIYGLHHPDNNRIRYVGKSVNPEQRLYLHIFNGRHNDPCNTHLSRWIKKILNEGKRPKYTILEMCTGSNWQKKERVWILKLQKNNLCNRHEGGTGGAPGIRQGIRQGVRQSPEILERKKEFIQRWEKIGNKIPIGYEKDVLKKYPDKKITTIQNARYCRTYDLQVLEVLEQLVKNK